ncbi:MAG: PepSY domain-containing protein [Alphaproteobacteria bacterium]|nr:PepSY domain-containing protein [Alphaproteobacteria bacterium]
MTLRTAATVFAALAFIGGAHAQTGPVATQCAADIAKYCANLSHGGGAVRACLEEHEHEVTQACRTALETTGHGSGMGQGNAMMPPRDVTAKLEGMGYGGIRDIEREDGHYEVKATDKDGHRVELYIDAMTGAILRSERDD